MTKKSKTLLILSCIFVTIAAILSFIHLYLSFGLYSTMFTNPDNLGTAIGEIFALMFFIVYSIIFAAGILISSGLTIGFVIPLLKINGKKWYSIVILVVAIVAILLAVFAIVMIPAVSNIASQAKGSTSSSSSEAISQALTLF
ncbi:MAG: hypothetical protein IJR08_04910 [Bacilli bacterium]|nr:hypothetical protein [Bacilli bacterium]